MPTWWRRAALIGAATFLCVLLGTGCAYRWVAARALRREVASAPRDPDTGILLGAEPVTLGSSDRGVLLIHGFVGSPRDYGELPRRLAGAGFRVHCPLLPGHGTKPQDLLDQSPDTLAAAVEKAYLDMRKRCKWVAVVGFSMGGTLAARLAAGAQVPRDGVPPGEPTVRPAPDALVLVCPFFGATYRWYVVLPPETWNRLLMPVLPYVVKGTAFQQIKRSEGAAGLVSYDTVPTRAIRDLSVLAACVRRQPARHLPAHTLLIYSRNDGAASPRRIRDMADKWGLPPSSRILLTRSNHLVFWDYDCETAIKAVIQFLSRASDRNASAE